MKVTVMPILGQVKDERLTSLTGCHALYERRVVKRDVPMGQLDSAVGNAIRELCLADRVGALSGKLSFVVSVEL